MSATALPEMTTKFGATSKPLSALMRLVRVPTVVFSAKAAGRIRAEFS